MTEQPTNAGADYRPIVSISLPNVGDFEPKGLVLVVGPNSAGKTQLLQDVSHTLTGAQREFVVCKQITLASLPEGDTLIQRLEDDGYCKREIDNNGNEQIRPMMPHTGLGVMRGGNQSIGNVRSYVARQVGMTECVGRVRRSEFFEYFGHAFSTILFLDRRLGLSNSVSGFDYETQAPQNDIQALYLNQSACEKLSEEIASTFKKGIWIDNTRGNVLCLRISQKATLPTDAERLSPAAMKRYRLIETEGDGLKSYVGICISLLLGLRHLCLIDEPEMCLHPPQAYALGKFIGRNATSEKHTTFVSTHSSHVLRGVVETTENVRILRLSRLGEQFVAHVVPYEAIKSSLETPTVRAETILDGIFSDGVSVVEADGDRAVYEAAWSHVVARIGRDASFIPVGGTGGIAQTVTLYRALKIPVSVIADLDLVADSDKMKKTATALADKTIAKELTARCRAICEKIRAIPPIVAEADVKAELKAISEGRISWAEEDDIVVRQKLSHLVHNMGRKSRLKRGGVNGFSGHADIATELKNLIAQCEAIGLFLVPVGELERWMSHDGTGRKAEWANEAARRIRSTPDEAKDLIAFVEKVGRFQSHSAERIAAEGVPSTGHVK